VCPKWQAVAIQHQAAAGGIRFEDGNQRRFGPVVLVPARGAFDFDLFGQALRVIRAERISVCEQLQILIAIRVDAVETGESVSFLRGRLEVRAKIFMSKKQIAIDGIVDSVPQLGLAEEGIRHHEPLAFFAGHAKSAGHKTALADRGFPRTVRHFAGGVQELRRAQTQLGLFILLQRAFGNEVDYGRKALAPYNAEPGPRTISIRSTLPSKYSSPPKRLPGKKAFKRWPLNSNKIFWPVSKRKPKPVF